MNVITNFTNVTSASKLITHISVIKQPCLINLLRSFSTSPTCSGNRIPEPKHWMTYNDKVFPPQEPGEERRPAYVCHMKTNVKCSYKKMWYIAVMVRGLQIDEAINQLKFVNRKGAVIARETLEEAKEMAVKEQNVEYATNLWVAESFIGKGFCIKGMRRHARGRIGEIRYQYIHYFVRLEEGQPPEHYYYYKRPLTPQEKLDNWLKEKRERTISFSF